MPTDQYKVLIRADMKSAGEHARRFNEPVTNEVVVVIVGNDFEKRDILLEKKNGRLERVSETHGSYDALQYPLIFWKNEDDYHFFIEQTDPTTGMAVTSKKVSAMSFYAYRIIVRTAAVNHILQCRRLFHQKLRVDEYIHLKDAIDNDGRANNRGQLVILPATFTGSLRHMHEYTREAMTYWQEIQEELMEGQAPSDRQDLLARVFRQKLIQLANIITKVMYLGQQDARYYDSRPMWKYQSKLSVYGKQKVYKKISKQLLSDTETGDDGYPSYRRRSSEDGGIKAKIKMRINNSIQEIEIDNKWVVPYCPLLSRIFQAHINLEYCNSVKSIKYICKYVNKGSNQAVFGLGRDGVPVDEISNYQLGKYISSNEAVWRILDFPIHERYPTVVHLAVHLEKSSDPIPQC
ncbi:unnamed protein product [Rotaria magnacalcarata]|uniref:Helitron helicase-like domain-containing protein n=1 Tax=Rotaria magnacalcarata TaxID=392030 RepID=A0A819PZH0_9BILA|nr:unnamed protein product [Rotaria magnacalcarata]